MEPNTAPAVKMLLPNFSRLLYLAASLTFIAGIQLFVGTEHTDQYFAWTIPIPLTAAFLGANYLASTLVSFFSARQKVWARMRAAIPGVFVFTTLLTVATFMHLDKFRLDSVPGWAWLIVYVAVPPLLFLCLFLQWRAPGGDPVRVAPLQGWLKVLLVIQGLILLGFGIALFFYPVETAPYWPWKLTPLTARAVASWLCGIGLVAIQSTIENDWTRLGPAVVTYLAVGIFQTIALLRYPSLDPSRPATWAYLLFLASVLFVGFYSCAAAWRARER